MFMRLPVFVLAVASALTLIAGSSSLQPVAAQAKSKERKKQPSSNDREENTAADKDAATQVFATDNFSLTFPKDFYGVKVLGSSAGSINIRGDKDAIADERGWEHDKVITLRVTRFYDGDFETTEKMKALVVKKGSNDGKLTWTKRGEECHGANSIGPIFNGTYHTCGAHRFVVFEKGCYHLYGEALMIKKEEASDAFAKLKAAMASFKVTKSTSLAEDLGLTWKLEKDWWVDRGSHDFVTFEKCKESQRTRNLTWGVKPEPKAHLAVYLSHSAKRGASKVLTESTDSVDKAVAQFKKSWAKGQEEGAYHWKKTVESSEIGKIKKVKICGEQGKLMSAKVTMKTARGATEEVSVYAAVVKVGDKLIAIEGRAPNSLADALKQGMTSFLKNLKSLTEKRQKEADE